jgi:hypothetical protein
MEDSNFAKKAFMDAEEAEAEKEEKAYYDTCTPEGIDGDVLAAGLFVGMGNIEALCKAVFEAGLEDVLSQYTLSIHALGFKKGYNARKELESKQ